MEPKLIFTKSIKLIKAIYKQIPMHSLELQHRKSKRNRKRFRFHVQLANIDKAPTMWWGLHTEP